MEGEKVKAKCTKVLCGHNTATIISGGNADRYTACYKFTTYTVKCDKCHTWFKHIKKVRI